MVLVVFKVIIFKQVEEREERIATVFYRLDGCREVRAIEALCVGSRAGQRCGKCSSLGADEVGMTGSSFLERSSPIHAASP